MVRIDKGIVFLTNNFVQVLLHVHLSDVQQKIQLTIRVAVPHEVVVGVVSEIYLRHVKLLHEMVQQLQSCFVVFVHITITFQIYGKARILIQEII